MTGASERGERGAAVERNRVARSVFAAAEAMGITDRDLLEGFTNQVIQRLEQAPTLPGMEHLAPQKRRRSNSLPPEIQIQDMVKDILRKSEVVSMVTVSTAIPLTENAQRVLEKRYLKRAKDGKVIETPEGMFRRVAKTVASAEIIYQPGADVARWEEEFYQVMADLEFLPNSPTLMNAGRELGQLSACFVLPVEDSIESIFDAVKYTALIHKSGGGTGFSFSRLRPEKDRVGSTGGVASGPISFMRAFDTATDVIKQGGMRRGANMGILNVNHPDIWKFITAKEDPEAFTNFNLSVAVSAEFMEAVEGGTEYDLVNPHSGEVVGKAKAREIFDKMVDMAWRNGDPGIIFLDRINRDNPTPNLGAIESTNPCGEQPLLPFESCNLGSINLIKVLRKKNGSSEIDYPRLARTVKLAVRFLDNVIDVNKFPLPQIAERTRATRKIGLGVMGFADMLLMLAIPYNSEEALHLAGDLMSFIDDKALEASIELAQEREVFPAFAGSIYDLPGKPQVRNASRTTIAPTGTLSIIAGCSSGIEPLFALSYIRHILDGESMVEVSPYFEEVARRGGFYSLELMQRLATGGRLGEMEGVPEDIKRTFVTAHDIIPDWHVKMQVAFQRFTNNAVSKTVNFPHDATREDVSHVYMLAFKEGVKGITIYRDGSREGQVLSVASKEPAAEKQEEAAEDAHMPRQRPLRTTGSTDRVTTGCGNIYVSVNSDGQGICEVFAHLGKSGGCASAQLEATCRLISLALRSGVDISSVVKHLKGIRCPSPAWQEGRAILSCADAIGSVLESHLKGTAPTSAVEKSEGSYESSGQCPECGGLLIYQEGCHKCHGCGYTKC